MLKNCLSLPHARKILSLNNLRQSSRSISKYRESNHQKKDTFSKKKSKSREKRSIKISKHKTYTADSDLEGKNYYKKSESDNTYITESNSKEARFTKEVNPIKIVKKKPGHSRTFTERSN